MTDGGWDQNIKSDLVLFHLGRLFRILDKDVIMQFHYAPGSSAFNFIERMFSWLSNKLTGVKIPATLPNELEAPCQQSSLTEVQRDAKTKLVMEVKLKVPCNT